MTVLLEATKGRLNERLAAHRRGLAMKFGTRPLRRHAIAFSSSFRHLFSGTETSALEPGTKCRS
jgi:hypothetical protein